MRRRSFKTVFILLFLFISFPAWSQPATVDFVQAAENSIHAVVHIQCEYEQETQFYSDFFWFLPPRSSSRTIQTSGSGVIISEDGYIITNNHVVQDAQKISVTLNDRRNFQAELIGNDPEADLAVIKINQKGLPFLTYGNSDDTKIGQWVLAVGNPFNLTSTVTAGIISAKARNLNILGRNMSETPLEFYIQTDAAVNRGNSGGALVNTEGKLIGINTAIASNTGSYAGYSFAIPSNIVKKVTNDLIQYGRTQKAYLGVNIAEVDAKVADYIGVNQTKGIYFASVSKDGAAYHGGIVQGDILLRVNDKEINTLPELNEIMAQHSPGEKITITYEREKKIKETQVTLLNKNGNTEVILPEKSNFITVINAQFRELTDKELRGYGVNSGYEIKKLNGSPLAKARIKPGFIITSIGGERDIDLGQLLNLDKMKGRVVIEGFYPTDTRLSYYVIFL
jgi:Do/DeqQ family serine protease